MCSNASCKSMFQSKVTHFLIILLKDLCLSNNWALKQKIIYILPCRHINCLNVEGGLMSLITLALLGSTSIIH